MSSNTELKSDRRFAVSNIYRISAERLRADRLREKTAGGIRVKTVGEYRLQTACDLGNG